MIPAEFLIFGVTLLGVAVFHRHTLGIAVAACWRSSRTRFSSATSTVPPGRWPAVSPQYEWVLLANLFALLVGFALLSRHFEQSHVPHLMPRLLPDGWKGGLALLAIVFVLSGFLDNIAAAMIGATVASTVFRGKVHIAYLAAIVAASNAGGAGSVVGDTTTTMMWLAGISPLEVLRAYIAAIAAFFVFAIPAARRQQGFRSIMKDPIAGVRLDVPRIIIVALVLVGAIGANVYANSLPEGSTGAFPYIGATVIGILLLLTPWRRPDWSIVPEAARGSLFLLSLVVSASMMPVQDLPPASAQSTFGLGFVSAVFDNIPLTKLALEQGGYDWAVLAFSVGFGGSMTWFGSSAGVAVSNLFPEAKSVGQWLRQGWYIAVGYVVGFFVLILIAGWNPHGSRPGL